MDKQSKQVLYWFTGIDLGAIAILILSFYDALVPIMLSLIGGTTGILLVFPFKYWMWKRAVARERRQDEEQSKNDL